MRNHPKTPVVGKKGNEVPQASEEDIYVQPVEDKSGEGISHQWAERIHAGAYIHTGAHEYPIQEHGNSLKELGP